VPNPYSRTEWTELQQRFRPPRDGPVVSTRRRDYASLEEIDIVVAALQLRRRELSVDEVAPKLKIGVRMLSETVRADAREGDIGMQLGGSYPFFDPQHGPNIECGAARPRCA
jgi:hypothetical protein